jgi:DNA-binding transcriptional LysR family regulator
MRAEWDVAKYLRSGRLIQVLADFDTPPADVYAVYLERLNLSAKVAYFVEHLRAYLDQHADRPGQDRSNW